VLEVSLRADAVNWTKERLLLKATREGFSPISPGGHRTVRVPFLANKKSKGFPEVFFYPDYLQGFPTIRVKVTVMPVREVWMWVIAERRCSWTSLSLISF